MIGISSLLEGVHTFGDQLRYSASSRHQQTGTHEGSGPVVVWNVTRTCNLHCIHCYSDSEAKRYEGELSTAEAVDLIDQFAAFRVPVLLFSGGEPFIRHDVLDLAAYAIKKGIRVTFSTNGTLIDADLAREIKRIGVSYVGISLDGIGPVHDRFRRQKGAYDRAVRGIRNCLSAGQKVGLRFTMNAHNIDQLPFILDLLEEEQIPRACFYHLVYSGRGSAADDITHAQRRRALDLIIERVIDFRKRGINKEILTVDNHADGVYLYLKIREQNPELAQRIYAKLYRNGGNRSGIAVCNVDSQGLVHPDQFSQDVTFGSVREQPFAEIWQHAKHPVLTGLRDRRSLLKGRCGRCRFIDLCNGGFRPRAQAYYGDYWAPDPQCYLTDEEIGLDRRETDVARL